MPHYKMGKAWGRWECSRNSFFSSMLILSLLLDRHPREGVESADTRVETEVGGRICDRG